VLDASDAREQRPSQGCLDSKEHYRSASYKVNSSNSKHIREVLSGINGECFADAVNLCASQPPFDPSSYRLFLLQLLLPLFTECWWRGSLFELDLNLRGACIALLLVEELFHHRLLHKEIECFWTIVKQRLLLLLSKHGCQSQIPNIVSHRIRVFEPVSFFIRQSWNGFLDKSSHLLFSLFFFSDADVLLLSRSDYSQGTMYNNSNEHTQHHHCTVSIWTKRNTTVAHDEPRNEECCRNPCNMILCLKLGRSVQNLGPILRAQNLIHCQEGVPHSTEGHFVLIPELIDCRNIPSNQLTGKYPDKKRNHKQERDQIQDTVDVAEDFFLQTSLPYQGLKDTSRSRVTGTAIIIR